MLIHSLKNILDEVYDLPTEWPVRPDLLQKVSRLTGAFTENHADGKVCKLSSVVLRFIENTTATNQL